MLRIAHQMLRIAHHLCVLQHALVYSTISYCVATCMHDALVCQGRRKRYGRYGFGRTTFLEETMRGRKFARRGIRYASEPPEFRTVQTLQPTARSSTLQCLMCSLVSRPSARANLRATFDPRGLRQHRARGRTRLHNARIAGRTGTVCQKKNRPAPFLCQA